MSLTESISQLQHVAGSSIFSLLPVEIVRYIFEISARDNSQTATKLVHVSKCVHDWVLPILYETIVLRRPVDYPQLGRIFASWGHLALLVRNIGISNPDGQAEFFDPVLTQHTALSGLELYPRLSILALFYHNVQNIYINDSYPPVPFPADLCPYLKHLHFGSWGSWMNHNILALTINSLTHLRVDLAYNNGLSRSWIPLLAPSRSLPNLTHFAIGTDQRNVTSELRGTVNFLRGILARPGIVMLVLTTWFCWVDSGEVSEVFAGASDRRLCILMMQGCPTAESSLTEWEDEARGRQSIWDKADAVLERHRRSGGQGVAIGMS